MLPRALPQRLPTRDGETLTVNLPAELVGRCVMCGGPGPLTDEHVISKTVRKQMPLLSSVTRTFAGHTTKPMNVLHMVLRKAVCKPCNGGWMGDLEADLVKIMGAQIADPQRTTLNPSEQERVATWAIKTALLLEVWTSSKGRGSYVPTDNLRWLAAHHTPPAFAQVWMAGIHSEMKRLAWSQSGFLALATHEKVACVATFTVGSLGFQVFARDIEDPNNPGSVRPFAALQPPQAVLDTTLEIWPGSAQDVTWPRNDTILSLDALPAWAKWPTSVFDPYPDPPHGPP